MSLRPVSTRALAPAPTPAASGGLWSALKGVGASLAKLTGEVVSIGGTVATHVSCTAADVLLDPAAKLAEGYLQSANDARLAGDRARAAEWLRARGIDATRRNAILAIVQRAALWHGTGRFQYAAAGASKYDGVTQRPKDTLGAILDQRGLAPQYDAYYSSGARDGRTLSLAYSRMYARYYAQLHHAQGDELRFQYGTAGSWVVLMGAHLGVSGIGDVVLTHAVGVQEQPDIRHWASTAHREPDAAKILTGEQRSDIAGNYGVLFGIRRGAIATVALHSRMRRIEARTDRPVRLTDMTHVEVPANRVDAVARELRARGIGLPVLAMEDVEAVLSAYSTTALVTNELAAQARPVQERAAFPAPSTHRRP